jgi:hypothetical protein
MAKKSDKVGKGAGGKSATELNKKIRGAARGIVKGIDSLLGKPKKKQK